MCSIFIHYFNTFFIRLILIDFPVDKDKSSISLRNLNIFVYDLSTLLIIKSVNFELIIICLSDKVFVIITFKRSSVGSSMPIKTKLSRRDFKYVRIQNLKRSQRTHGKLDHWVQQWAATWFIGGSHSVGIFGQEQRAGKL